MAIDGHMDTALDMLSIASSITSILPLTYLVYYIPKVVSAPALKVPVLSASLHPVDWRDSVFSASWYPVH